MNIKPLSTIHQSGHSLHTSIDTEYYVSAQQPKRYLSENNWKVNMDLPIFYSRAIYGLVVCSSHYISHCYFITIMSLLLVSAHNILLSVHLFMNDNQFLSIAEYGY